VLVEPREPYRVKAGILEVDSSFEVNLGLIVSLDIAYSDRERQPLGL
jgi:hypothetical protein